MNSSLNAYFARLNPAERRFVIGVAVLFFIVINFFWVWPHFSDWGDIQRQLGIKRATLATYLAMIQQQPALQLEFRKLSGQGPTVPPEDQATEFFRTINTTASQNGVSFIGNSRSVTRTNQFFVEWVQTVQVQATEKQLVDFLYALGSDNSMIRVRALSVHPDPSRQQLSANITLIASYQRNANMAAVASAPSAAAPAPAPAAATSTVKPAAASQPHPTTPATTGGSARPQTPASTARPQSPNQGPVDRNVHSLVVKTSAPPANPPILKPPQKP